MARSLIQPRWVESSWWARGVESGSLVWSVWGRKLAPEMFLRELGKPSTAGLSIRPARSAEKALSINFHMGLLIRSRQSCPVVVPIWLIIIAARL